MPEASGAIPVASGEMLARYILKKDYVRADGTLRQDAFIPKPYVELSVTRHLDLGETGIWAAGHVVSKETNLPLLGRADVTAETFIGQGLPVVPDPTPTNAYHANVVGWPEDKPAQKIKALEIAAAAVYRKAPDA